MQRFILFFLFTLPHILFAQVTGTADGDSGSGYPALLSSGFEIETPDCIHQNFGAHVTQTYDVELDRNVFVFHSHIEEDNDRCLVFDRVRMEIKGSANSDERLQHVEGSTSYYRWKFRLDDDFIGASSFTHLFQNKAVGGDDTSFPIITITARAGRVEVLHNGGDTGGRLGRLATAGIERFRGRWVEGYLRQTHAEEGAFEVTLRDMETGLTILAYSNENIDLWRAGARLNRPKWGVYRRKNEVLRDEEVRFANFCVSNVSAELCPAEAVLRPDTEAPTSPMGLTVTGTTFTTISLEWEASSDVYGVTEYIVYQGGDSIASVLETEFTVTGLANATGYTFSVAARDAAGNTSEPGTSVSARTDNESALPGVATSPNPANGSVGVVTTAGLSWVAGDNTASHTVYFGTEADPPLVSAQQGASYQAGLQPHTTYFWRVASTNANGTVTGPVWAFTTAGENQDAPWFVYRGNLRPEAETGFFALRDAPITPAIDEIRPEAGRLANNIFAYHSEDQENFRWRFPLERDDSTITVIARLKGLGDDVNGMMHLDFRAFGWRQKVRINQEDIKLERSDPQVTRPLPFDWNDEYHLVRIVVTGPQTTVYLDEHPEPFVTATSATPIEVDYFEFGKSGGSNYGALVDYLAINRREANAPGEGSRPPEDLIGFSPLSTQFTAELGEILIYPNPAHAFITFSLPRGESTTGSVFDLAGRRVQPLGVLESGRRMYIGDLPRGVYLLLAEDRNGRQVRQKFIKY